MKEVYKVIGISKQAFHQHLDRKMKRLEEQQQLLPVIGQMREDHPRMAARVMYSLLNPQYMGRDVFIEFCFANNFKLEVKRSAARTTESATAIRFENLIKELELTGVNQVWVSDITYYQMGEVFYYITLITDLYSRYIRGYCASKNLLTENTTIAALRMALKHTPIFKELILHSDGGGQYYSKEFLKITRKHNIGNSMAENVFENPHAERVIKTIKNDYLIHYGPQNFEELRAMLKKAVLMYNWYRPHQALKRLSPGIFEQLSGKNGLGPPKGNSLSPFPKIAGGKAMAQFPRYSSVNPACSLRFPITSHAGKGNAKI